MIFIWIPKTGGTSLFSVLKEEQGYSLYTEDYSRYEGEENVSFGHAYLPSLIRLGHLTVDDTNFNTYFTVVRNPYDRFASLYKDFKRTKRIPEHWQPIDFAYSLDSGIQPIGAYNDLGNSQCNPQVRWIIPHTEIHFLEMLVEGITGELSLADPLPHLNADPTPFVWTPELRRLVNKIYLEDFAFLGYEMINE